MEVEIESERKTEAYTVTLKIYILNINKIENIHNHHKRHCRTIYKVIQQEFFDETDISPEEFLKYCKNNSNVPFIIPPDIKNDLKKMAME